MTQFLIAGGSIPAVALLLGALGRLLKYVLLFTGFVVATRRLRGNAARAAVFSAFAAAMTAPRRRRPG